MVRGEARRPFGGKEGRRLKVKCGWKDTRFLQSEKKKTKKKPFLNTKKRIFSQRPLRSAIQGDRTNYLRSFSSRIPGIDGDRALIGQMDVASIPARQIKREAKA